MGAPLSSSKLARAGRYELHVAALDSVGDGGRSCGAASERCDQRCELVVLGEVLGRMGPGAKRVRDGSCCALDDFVQSGESLIEFWASIGLTAEMFNV